MTKRRKFLKDAALLSGSSFLPINISYNNKRNYQKAPFKKLDTLSTNDWWNRAKNPILDLDVPRNEVIAFGIYTVSHDVLKLTAQFFPLFPNESRDVRFAIKKDGKWEEIATETINDIGWNSTFRIETMDVLPTMIVCLVMGSAYAFRENAPAIWAVEGTRAKTS